MSLPLAYPHLFFISWIGLIPFLFIIKKRNILFSYKAGTVMGITIFLCSTGWLYYPIVNYSGLPWLIAFLIFLLFIILVGSIYGIWGLVFTLIKKKDKLSPFWLAISWIGIEYVRFIFLTDFPFAFTGYTQVGFPWLLQLAEYGGFFLIGFVVILINGYLYLAIYRRKIKFILPVILMLSIIMVIGIININNYKSNNFKKINVGIVMTNLLPDEKWKVSNIESNIKYLIKQTKKIEKNDLIVWPESAVTFDLIRNEYYRNIFYNMFGDIKTNIQIGSLAIIDNKKEKYNSSFLITDGKIKNRYNKIKLVPFGEYMPFSNIVEFISGLTLFSETPGKETVIFKTNFASWRTTICSEILQSELIQDKVEKAQFFVNQSNEGWYKRGSLQTQMWTAAIFRAVENRRAVVKAGNMAYGGVISPSGLALAKKHSANSNTITAKVPLVTRQTFYQEWGDFVGYISAGFLLIFFVIKIYNIFFSHQT